jgi:cytochrome P450
MTDIATAAADTAAADTAAAHPRAAAETGSAAGTPVAAAVLAALASPAGRRNPYPHYAALRALGPAVYAPDGSLVVSGYRQCAALLRDHRLTKSPGRFLTAAGHPDWRERPALRLLFGSMLMLNPPEHTRLRRAVSAAFTPARVARLESAVVELTDDLLDGFAEQLRSGCADFVSAVAFPLPITVIGELLGIPPADRPDFQELARDWTAVLDDLDPATVARADLAAARIREYLHGLAADRRADPRDDLVSALVRTGDPLAEDDLVTTVALLLAAGFETTTSLLANGLLALLAQPDQAARLRAEPGLADACVEELLRYDSPVQLLYGRTADAELEAAGLVVAAGTRVITLVGAANRDPEVFADPDRLDLGRSGPAPLSFGGGVHYCVGAPLARLEGRVAFPRLLRRLPGLELAGEPVHRPGLTLHGYTRLPVALGRSVGSGDRLGQAG